MTWILVKLAILAVVAVATLGIFPDRLRGGIVAIGTCIVATVILHFAAP